MAVRIPALYDIPYIASLNFRLGKRQVSICLLYLSAHHFKITVHKNQHNRNYINSYFGLNI